MSAPPDDSSAPSFEQSLEFLEGIVHDLEDGQVGLTESLAKYEQGVKLLKQCYELLQQAERKIELLTKVDASGQAIVEPFDDSPTTSQTAGESTGAPTRSRRRSAKPSASRQPNTNIEMSGEALSEIDVPRSLF